MNDCKKCGKIYADQFETCPHCAGAKQKALGCTILIVLALFVAAGFKLVLDDKLSTSQPSRVSGSTAPDGPPTGPDDPYAIGQRALGASEYERAKLELISRARMAASAARCRVIADVEAQMIDRRGIQTLSDADLSAGRSDYHPDLVPAITSAAQKAYSEASQPGGCDFWRENPAAVAELRRLANLATTGP
jgi:hypothetical protein